ncbi:TRAP transporter small permease [Pseudooceanicola nanhaiensis]|uniref:TRAP transporter small permease n=1 Tax=Pseudooceanicola nanhaiensis TaxID=375761 RepID=UPI001CD45973|nr:TRAP transporter small permease [Pseudooceanicola nanhaiensis]MCA0918809.1 TRAP transporter small permease [Pseudooceanicola nanhaiensis]
MRRLLDTLYLISGALAALSILAICLLVSAQVGLNILARLGGPSLSYTIPSYADFAGYMLAAASFLALAPTFRHGGHIRVNLFLSRMGEGGRWALELFSLAVAGCAMAYAAWYALALLLESHHYGDKSTGMIAIPIWIPQIVMVAGLILLTLSIFDRLVESLLARRPVLIDDTTE